MDDEIKKEVETVTKAIIDMLSKVSKSTGAFGKEIDKETKKLQDLARAYDTAKEGLEELEKTLETGEDSMQSAFTSALKFEQQMLKSKGVIDDETKARLKSIKSAYLQDQIKTGALNAAEGLIKGAIDFAIDASKAVISELQGNGNAFSLTTKVMSLSLDRTNNAMQAVGEGMDGLGNTLTMVLPGWWKALGVALSGLGKILGFTSAKASDVAKFGLEVLNTEVQKTIQVFGDNSKAGIFFADGMGALSKEFTDAGLSYRTFFGALKNSAEDLTAIGGNAGAGARQVKNTFMAMEPFRKGLLNLGISVEEQVEGTAEYMSMLARSGQLQGKTQAELAKGTDTYLTNLKIISSITGEEAKAAQARAKKAAEQQAIQTTLMNLSGSAQEKFQNAVKQFPASTQTAVQQMLEFGTVTDTQLAAAINQVPGFMDILQQYANDIRDPAVDARTALERYNQAIGSDAIKQQTAQAAAIGRANLAIGALGKESEVIGDIQRQVVKAQQGGVVEAGKLVDEQKNTTDELTNSVSQATLEFQKMQAALEQDLYGPMTKFAEFTAAMIEETRDRIKKAMDDLESWLKSKTVTGPAVTTGTYSETTGQPGDVAGAVTGSTSRGGFRRMERKALGGIVNAPAIAGEAGPEAVVPLPDGRTIPTNLDLSPLISALQQQIIISTEMLEEIKDSKYVQEKILTATM